MLRRSTHLFARAVGASMALLTVMLAVIVWRLASGPVSLSMLDPYMTEILAQGTPGYSWAVDETVLDWSSRRPSLAVTVTGVEISDMQGDVVARVPRLDLGLSGRALLAGRISPTSVELDGPSITVYRAADGSFRLGIAVPAGRAPVEADPGTGEGFSDLTARAFRALLAPPGQDGMAGALERFAVRNAKLTYRDARLGTVWRARDAHFSLDRSAAGIDGEGAVGIEIAGQTWTLGVTGRFDRGVGETRVDIAFADVEPRRLANESGPLAPLKGLSLPVSGTVGLRLGPEGEMYSVAADLRAAAGEIDVPELWAEPLALDRLGIALEYVPDARLLKVSQAEVERGTLRLSLSGEAKFGDGSPGIRMSGELSDLPTEEFKKLWPIPAARGSRGWFLANMADGEVTEAQFEANIAEGLIGTGPLPDNAYRVALQFRDVTSHYLRPMPPLRKGRGSGVLTARRFELQVDEAFVLDDLQATEGQVEIRDLHLPDKAANVSLVLTGSVARSLQLLDSPPLSFPSKYGIVPLEIGGAAATRLRLSLPLRSGMQLQDINFATATNLRGLRFPNLLNNIALEEGDILLQVNGAGLEARGSARFLDVDTDLVWREKFGVPEPELSSAFSVSASADEAQLEALGFPTAGLIAGPADLSIEMRGRGSRIAVGHLKGDLTDAELIADPLSWRKPVGEAATITFDFALPADEKTGARLENIRLAGDGIDVAGRMAFEPAGPPSSIVMERLGLGADNDLTGSARHIGEGVYAITASGARADISRPIAELLGKIETGDTEEEGVPFELEGELAALAIGKDTVLRDVKASASFDGEYFQKLSVDGNFRPNVTGIVRLGPDADGNRTLGMTTGDAGLVLRGLDLFDSGVGGELELSAEFLDSAPRPEGEGPPMQGQFAIRDIQVNNTPILARILTIGSLTGIRDLLAGSGIAFERVEAPFRMEGDIISVKDAFASGSALGITLNGTLNTTRGEADMKGTVIPAYTLNTVFGRVPLLGPMLTGGKNGGVFAINYSLKGPIEDPRIGVNPLSALTPGFLRRIFDLGDISPPVTGDVPAEEEPE